MTGIGGEYWTARCCSGIPFECCLILGVTPGVLLLLPEVGRELSDMGSELTTIPPLPDPDDTTVLNGTRS